MSEESKVEKSRRKLRYFSTQLIVILMIIVIVLVYFGDAIFIVVKAGQKGVLFRPYNGGTQLNRTYDEGLHIIFPWNEMAIYNCRIQKVHDSVQAIAINGVQVRVDFSVNFRPNVNSVGYLHKNIGPNYVNVVIIPEAGAAVREIISLQDPEELYNAKRNALQKTILRKLKREVGERYLDFIDIQIENIILPQKVENAIEDKIVSRQKELTYVHLLSAQKQEVQRMKLEAEGIRLFESISKISVLKWKGLQVTESIAKSKNAKVVIMGSSEGSLPIILGNGGQ